MGKNADLLRKALGFFTKGDLEGLARLLAQDIQVNVPGNNQLSGTYKSRDDFFGRFIGKVMELTAGQFVLDVHDVTESDDHAVGIYNMKATRDGKTFEWRHVNIYHIKGEAIAEVWQVPADFEAWNAFWQ